MLTDSGYIEGGKGKQLIRYLKNWIIVEGVNTFSGNEYPSRDIPDWEEKSDKIVYLVQTKTICQIWNICCMKFKVVGEQYSKEDIICEIGGRYIKSEKVFVSS